MTRGATALHSLDTHSATLNLHCPKAFGAGWYVRTPLLLMLGGADKIEQLPIGVTLNTNAPVPAYVMLLAHWVGSGFVFSGTVTSGAAENVGPARH
jgi:hypothetical protein